MRPVDILRTFDNFDPEQLTVQEGNLEAVEGASPPSSLEAILSVVRLALTNFEDSSDFKQTEAQDLKDRVIQKLERITSAAAMPSSAGVVSASASDSLREEKSFYRDLLLDEKLDPYLPEGPRSKKGAFIEMLDSLGDTLLAINPSQYIIRQGISYGATSQDVYASDVQNIVSFLHILFDFAKKSDDFDLKELFHIALLFTAKRREKIAILNETPYNCNFGEFRYNYKGEKGIPAWTILGSYSKAYELKIKEMIASIVKIKPTNPTNIKKEGMVLMVHPQRSASAVNIIFELELHGGKILLSLLQNICLIDRPTDTIEEKIPHGIRLDHTAPSQLLKLMPHIAHQFEKILQMSSDDPHLMREMAFFQYLMAHACPFLRGSAAICEWFEMALFATHGFQVQYKPETCINLEALTTALPDFVESYEAGLFFEKLPLRESGASA